MSPRENEPLGNAMVLEDDLETDQSTEPSSDSRKVRFGSIQIREYNRILGDHPDVKVGPPISIGWEYAEQDPIHIDYYEQNRAPKRAYLRLSSITRKNMLHNVFGVPEEDIRAAEKEIQKIQRRRESALKQGKAGEAVETVVRSARRRLKRTFSRDSLYKSISAISSHMIPMSVHS